MNQPYSEIVHQICLIQFQGHINRWEHLKESFAAERKETILSHNRGMELNDIRPYVAYPVLRKNYDTFAFAIDWRVSQYSYRFKKGQPKRVATHRIKPRRRKNGGCTYLPSKFERFKIPAYEVEVIQAYEAEFDRLRLAASSTYAMKRAMFLSRPLNDERMDGFFEPGAPELAEEVTELLSKFRDSQEASAA